MGTSGVHLSERQKDRIIYLKTEYGMSTLEVARIVGVDPNTVRCVMRRSGHVEHQMSDPVIGHGFKEFARERRALINDAKAGKPEAIIQLARLGVTGYWTPETATIISRKGFSAAACMVAR